MWGGWDLFVLLQSVSWFFESVVVRFLRGLWLIFVESSAKIKKLYWKQKKHLILIK